MLQAMTRATLYPALLAALAFAQPPAGAPAFEVASVKPARPPSENNLRVSMTGDAGSVRFSNVTLRDVMTRAYSVKDHQITAPDWLRSERYDIVAKLPQGASRDQIPAMLETLLAERFQLKLHRETKVMPIYALVAGKNGPKLRETTESTGGMRMSMSPKGRQMSGKVTIKALSDALSRMMDRPVMDMTELKGTYDVNLEWVADENQPGLFGPGPRRPEGAQERAPDRGEGPSIFTAVQEQLGLRLEARKSPVEILVVDHVEKTPTEN